MSQYLYDFNQAKLKANDLGIEIYRSDKPNKKLYFVNPNTNLKVYFGDALSEDYTYHKDPKRRALYRARHSKIMKDVNGKKIEAYKVKYTPAWASYYILW